MTKPLGTETTAVKRRRDMKHKERKEQFGYRTITKYAPELAMEICAQVAQGKTLREVCNQPGMPHRVTFWKWAMLYPDVGKAYNAARELSAVALEEEALEMAFKLQKEAERMTNSAIRAFQVAMEQLRWSAARRNPGQYGTKAEGTVVIPVQINTTLNMGPSEVAHEGIYSIKAEGSAPVGDDPLSLPPDPNDSERLLIPRRTYKSRKEKDGTDEPIYDDGSDEEDGE